MRFELLLKKPGKKGFEHTDIKEKSIENAVCVAKGYVRALYDVFGPAYTMRIVIAKTQHPLIDITYTDVGLRYRTHGKE